VRRLRRQVALCHGSAASQIPRHVTRQMSSILCKRPPAHCTLHTDGVGGIRAPRSQHRWSPWRGPARRMSSGTPCPCSASFVDRHDGENAQPGSLQHHGSNAAGNHGRVAMSRTPWARPGTSTGAPAEVRRTCSPAIAIQWCPALRIALTKPLPDHQDSAVYGQFHVIVCLEGKVFVTFAWKGPDGKTVQLAIPITLSPGIQFRWAGAPRARC